MAACCWPQSPRASHQVPTACGSCSLAASSWAGTLGHAVSPGLLCLQDPLLHQVLHTFRLFVRHKHQQNVSCCLRGKAQERERERFTTSIQPASVVRTDLCACLEPQGAWPTGSVTYEIGTIWNLLALPSRANGEDPCTVSGAGWFHPLGKSDRPNQIVPYICWSLHAFVGGAAQASPSCVSVPDSHPPQDSDQQSEWCEMIP